MIKLLCCLLCMSKYSKGECFALVLFLLLAIIVVSFGSSIHDGNGKRVKKVAYSNVL